MGIETTPSTAISTVQGSWYRIGAAAALLLALGYIVIIPLYARVGAPPTHADAWFSYLPGKTALWWTILAISVFTDLLYLPVALALYLALKPAAKYTTALACALVGLFVSVDLAVTWTHYASILVLFQRYSAATDPSTRAACQAAVAYASAMLVSPLEIVYAIVILSSGILLIALVMLRSPFAGFTAWAGIATGLLGILCLTGNSLAVIGNALCATLWLIAVAVDLHHQARATNPPTR